MPTSARTSHLWLLIQEWMNAQFIRVNQAQLADAIGVTRQTVSQWKHRQVIPTPDNLQRISEVTRIPMAELLIAVLADMGYLSAEDLADTGRRRERLSRLVDSLDEAVDHAGRGRSTRIRIHGDDAPRVELLDDDEDQE